MIGTIITVAIIGIIVTLYARMIHWTNRAVVAEAAISRIETELELHRIVAEGGGGA